MLITDTQQRLVQAMKACRRKDTQTRHEDWEIINQVRRLEYLGFEMGSIG